MKLVGTPMNLSCNFLWPFPSDIFIPESLEDEGRSVLMQKRSCSRPTERHLGCPGWGQCNTFLQRKVSQSSMTSAGMKVFEALRTHLKIYCMGISTFAFVKDRQTGHVVLAFQKKFTRKPLYQMHFTEKNEGSGNKGSVTGLGKSRQHCQWVINASK